MVALSPVHEENKEVVTKNPMITAMAKGAQFHSSGGGSNRFNSNGGSSKFPSLGEASSNGGGSWMRGAQGDEEEEGGGMFADADVVAALAAAAAQGVGRKERTPLKTAASGTPKWDGSWAKSPAWNRQKSLAGHLSPSPLAAPKADEKKAEGGAQEAESKPDPEGGSSGEPTTDWMVFTRESFNSHKSADAAALLAAAKAQASLGAREEKKESVAGGTTGSVQAAPVEKKAEGLQSASTSNAVAAPGMGTGRPAAESYACSPQSVDGISAKAFEQAEVVTSALPVVEREGVLASEPECEVPKPALNAGRRGTAKRQSDYSWLLSAPGGGEKPPPDEDRDSRGSPVRTSPQKAALMDPSSMATAGLARTGSAPSTGTTSAAASKSPSKLPTEPVQHQVQHQASRAKEWAPPAQALPAQAPPAGGAATQHAGVPDNGSAATKYAQQTETPTLLHLPPKAQGAPPRRAHLAPVAGGGGRGFNLASPQAGGGRSPRGSKSPRGPRVSQFVEVFEGLTPRTKNGQASGILTAGAAMASPTFPPPVPGTSKTGPQKAIPPKLELPRPASASVPLPVATKRAPAPGGLAPGAATGWSTPVATPDRGSITAVPATRKAAQDAGGSNYSALRAAEDAGKIAAGMAAGKKGGFTREGVPSARGAGETSARGAGSAWSTPVASPDRSSSAAGGTTKASMEDLIAEEVPKDAADGAPEELATAESDAPAGGAGRGWSTPVATPDRTPRTSAPDSGPGGGTPECTGGAYPSKAGRTGESPIDERHFAWQLESPAGVDGMPSPTGSSDPRRLAIGKKGGRIIPAILGIADTPPVAERAPLLTPSTANNKAPQHSLGSTEGSSAGAGSTWDMERSFESSQVAAFVAHAQAEAAAEAEAAVVEARAEAAEEEAAEKKAAEEEVAEGKAAKEKAAEEKAADSTSRTAPQAARVESKDAATQSSPKPDYGEGRAGPASLEVAAGRAAAVPVAPGASPPGGAAGAGPAAGLSPVTAAPALATIAARLSPISAFPAASPPAIVATPSPITAISAPAVEEQKDLEGVNSQAEAQLDKALEMKAQSPTSEAAQAEAQASQAVKAALAAATAAAEANAAAAAAAAEAAKAAKKAEQAADEAAVAKAAKQKLADETAIKREAEEKEEAAEEVEEAEVLATKAEPAVAGGAVVGRTGDVGVVNVSIYSTDAVANAPDVYNDGQDTDTDTLDSQGDGSEEELEIDVGDERDWSTATAVIPVAATSSIDEVLTAPVYESGGDKQAGEEKGIVDGDGGAESEELAGAAAEQEQQEVDSLRSEAAGPSGLAANTVSSRDEVEGEEEGLRQAPAHNDDEDARRDAVEQYDPVSADAQGDDGGGYYAASPRESVHHLSSSKMLGSSSGALSWSEDVREEEGEAEREAKEVQALVAEALALVKEANEEA
ncbi:unnamed protein product [Scytosiphon promiscuus]